MGPSVDLNITRFLRLCACQGARPLAPGMKCVGNAVTVRFVPHRPDIVADKPQGVDSPEYVAFELCGPNEVSFPSTAQFTILRGL
jgi:regulator of RNase E activity RraA